MGRANLFSARPDEGRVDVNELFAEVHAEAESLIRRKSKRLAYKRIITTSDIDDILQDGLLDLWRRLHQYDPMRGDLRYFVRMLIRKYFVRYHIARHVLKRGGGRRNLSLDAPLSSKDSEPVTLGEDVHQDRRVHRGGDPDLNIDLADAMSGLSTRQRELCARRRDGGLSEVAREMGISRDSAKDLEERAQDKIIEAGIAIYRP